MNCNDIIEKIGEEIENYISILGPDGILIDCAADLEFEHQNFLRINTLIKKLYTNSVIENYFFFDCPFSVYESTYSDRLHDFLKSHIDANEVDFLKKEIEMYAAPYLNRKIDHSHFDIEYNDSVFNNYDFELSIKKKREFLSKKMKLFGFGVVLQIKSSPDETNSENYKRYDVEYEKIDGFSLNPTNNPDAILIQETKIIDIIEEEDFPSLKGKNAKQLSSNQVIILLEKLNFFDLKSVATLTKTKKAALVSSLVGYTEKNLKSHIEKLEYPPSKSGENYKRDVEKVETHLNKFI